jgi:hypothetical protein
LARNSSEEPNATAQGTSTRQEVGQCYEAALLCRHPSRAFRLIGANEKIKTYEELVDGLWTIFFDPR